MIRSLPLRQDDAAPMTKEYLDGQLTGMRAELAGMRDRQRADLRVEFNRALVWIIASIVAAAAVAVTLIVQLTG